jgi:hypothetical protein
MSAFVVGKEHINKILTAALISRYGEMSYYYNDSRHKVNDETIDTIGQMLLDENVKSVMYRYSDSQLTDLPGKTNAEYLIPFKYEVELSSLSGIQIIKLIQCLEYQSCEHPEWKTSEAYAFLEALIRRQFERIQGYDDAQWEWVKPIERNNYTRLV